MEGGSFGHYQKVISTSYVIGIAQVLKPPNHSLHPTQTLRRKADLCRTQGLYDDDNLYPARAQKLLVIFSQKLAFLPYLMPCPTKTIQTRYVGGFLICGYQTFAPSKNIRMLGPNTAIFAPKYAILDNRRPCPLIWCPDGWLVGCWLWRPGCSYDRASAYFMIYIMMKCLFVSDTKNEHLIKLPPSAPNVSWDLRERPKIITFSRGSVGPPCETPKIINYSRGPVGVPRQTGKVNTFSWQK